MSVLLLRDKSNCCKVRDPKRPSPREFCTDVDKDPEAVCHVIVLTCELCCILAVQSGAFHSCPLLLTLGSLEKLFH